MDKRNEKKKLSRTAIVFIVIGAVILAIIAAALIYWFATTAPPDVSTGGEDEADGSDITIYDPDEREVGRYYTLLIVGNDPEGGNTDTMMLCRYDTLEKTMNAVSIPRDTLVNVTGSNKKLNSVFHRDEEGGIVLLLDEIEKIAGFRPDSYVVVYPPDFVAAIDILGGVEFDVPVDMDYYEIHIPKGKQTLTGEQALGAFRYRHNYRDGDIDRLNVQHDLIKAVADKAMKLENIGKLYEIAERILNHAQTNLTLGNMQWYAAQFLSMDLDNVKIETLPGNIYCNIRNVSYVSIYPDEWLEMINADLNPLNRKIEMSDLEILYQVAYDGGSYYLDPNNYPVTNGAPVAGGLDSFYYNEP